MAGNLDGQHHGDEPLGDRSLSRKSSDYIRVAKKSNCQRRRENRQNTPVWKPPSPTTQRLINLQWIPERRWHQISKLASESPLFLPSQNQLLPIQGHPRANLRVLRPPLPVQIGHVCHQYHSSYFTWHKRLLKGLRVDFWGIWSKHWGSDETGFLSDDADFEVF
jgi:hypothetical protein